jgi:hypothetical protein
MLEDLPGYRRRIIVTPGASTVTAALEDDIHAMAVTLHHAGGVITSVEAQVHRVPWTTCPGAPAVLVATFTGVALGDAAKRGEKKANCTHLHDLAVLAAAHALDDGITLFEILSCDPVGGLVTAELRRNGATVLRMAHRDHAMVEPAAIAGAPLFALRAWIDTLDEQAAEAARLLQWGTIVAHGRTYPMDLQSDATKMPASCYSFQPGLREVAQRVGRIEDFSEAGARLPLAGFNGVEFAAG